MILKSDLQRCVIKQQTDLLKDLGVARRIQVSMIPKFATIISGIRRCGKSTLARQLLQGQQPIYYTNFEDLNLATFESQDFLKLESIFIEEFGTGGIFFFDELQNIVGWEKYVRQLVDNNERVLITGSNASMLSNELGTRLTGRHITKELYPFSYSEFLALKNQAHSIEQFRLFTEQGGFPEFLKTMEKDILKNLFQDIFYRDILQRNDLRNETAIKTLLSYAISNIGKEISYNKLKQLIGVGSGNTVSQFMAHFEEAYLLFSVKKFDYSLKKQLINPKKIYCIDNGIISTNSFAFSENKGRLLENMVFVELKRRNKEIFYYRDKHECDFVIRQGIEVAEVIQVCYELNIDNQNREINGLLESMKAFGLETGQILTFNQEDEIKTDGLLLSITPVWKWLLEE